MREKWCLVPHLVTFGVVFGRTTTIDLHVILLCQLRNLDTARPSEPVSV